jgi:tryptophanyl-tRNA synthetase
MSKSLGEKHYISLFGDEKTITKQIKSAITDSGEDTNAAMSPGVKNLFELLTYKAMRLTNITYNNGKVEADSMATLKQTLHRQ